MTDAPPAEPAKPKRRRIWKVLGLAVVLLIVAGIVAYFFLIESYRQFVSSINLSYSVYFVARMYANDGDQHFPPLSSEPGRLMYNPESFAGTEIVAYVHPWTYTGEPGGNSAYLPDLPKDKAAQIIRDQVDDQSYYYFGYAITNEVEGRAFVRAYKDTIARGGTFEDDLAVPMGEGNFGGDRLLRLRDDTVDFLSAERGMSEEEISRWESDVVVLMLNPRKRQKGWFPPRNRTRGMTCYLDSHIDAIEFPGAFPYTEEFLSALEELDRLSDNGPPVETGR